MHINQQQLLAHLDTHAIGYTLYSHQPLFTCEQALEVVNQLRIPGMGIKNLFLKDKKDRLYLITATHTTRIELKKVGKALEAKELRFAAPELLMEHLGVEPGSVTPLALINDRQKEVHIIIDAEIFAHEYIQIHPLKNDATVVISSKDLMAFFKTIQRTAIAYNFLEHQLQQ